MSDFLPNSGYVLADSFVTGTTVTTTANTKGAWAQITAATTRAWDYMQIYHYGIDAGGHQLVDIGVGGAGSEQIIIPDITKFDGTASTGYMFSTPCHIPAGSRVAARSATSVSSKGSTLQINGYTRSLGQPEMSRLYATDGIDTANSRGTSVTPAGSPSWTQIVASTSKDYNGFILQITTANSSSFVDLFDLEVGIGGSGSEVQIYKTNGYLMRFITVSSNVVTTVLSQIYIPVPIPAGTRIAVKAQLNFGTAFPFYFSTMGF